MSHKEINLGPASGPAHDDQPERGGEMANLSRVAQREIREKEASKAFWAKVKNGTFGVIGYIFRSVARSVRFIFSRRTDVPQGTSGTKTNLLFGLILIAALVGTTLLIRSCSCAGEGNEQGKDAPRRGVPQEQQARGKAKVSSTSSANKGVPASASVSGHIHGAHPDSQQFSELALSLAKAQAFSAALVELETSDAELLEQVTSDPDEDSYNLPDSAWASMIMEGNKAKQNWHFNADFSFARRDTVLTWWLAREFGRGVQADSLAHAWLRVVKALSTVPDEEAADYGKRVIELYNDYLVSIIDSPDMHEYRSSARNIITKERQSGQIMRSIIWLIVLAIVQFFVMAIMTSFSMTRGPIMVSIILGAGIGAVICAICIMPILNRFQLIGSEGSGPVYLACCLITAALMVLTLKPTK